MHTQTVRPVLALLLLLSACELGDPEPCEVRAARDVLPMAELSLIPTGEVAELSVKGPQLPACAPASAVPDTARVVVVDARNRVVPSSTVLESGPVARVEFQASAPGVYHVTATFEPGGYLFQRDVRVGADRSGPPHHLLPARCLRLARTTAGAWLCDGRVLRDGVEQQQLEGAVAVSGNRVWNVGAGGLSLLEDTGAGALALRARVDWSDEVQALAPTETGVVLASGHRLVPFSVQPDGTLWSPGETAVTTASPPEALVVEGDTVAVLADAQGPQPTGAPEGFQVCTFTLVSDAAPAPRGPCEQASGAPLPPEGPGVWVHALSTPRSGSPAVPTGVSFLRLREGTLERVAALGVFPAQPLVAPGGGSGATDVRPLGEWLVPLVLDGHILLERYALPDAESAHSSATLVWASVGPDETAVWAR